MPSWAFRFEMRARLILIGVASAIVGVLAIHNVPTGPTEADRTASQTILEKAGYGTLPTPRTYSEEIEAILAIQDAVLQIAPEQIGIPLGETREPADLLQQRSGLCYDRSRTIEKGLQAIGLTTRHVSMYETNDMSALRALTTPQVDSHAVTEVLTSRGWLVVDSNARWIALDADDQPLSIRQIGPYVRSGGEWSSRVPEPPTPLFLQSYVGIYGLYSRHGRFYPPMTPLPDVNYREALANLLGS